MVVVMCLPTKTELRILRLLRPDVRRPPVYLLNQDDTLSRGSVYTLLGRLVAKGLVGVLKHRYWLTQKGLAVKRACR